MLSQKHNSLYPEVVLSNPEAPTSSSTSPTTPSLYPSIDMDDLAQSLFPDGKDDAVPTKEEFLIKIPGSIVHLIQRDQSVELASGDFSVVGLKQGETTVAVLVRVGEDKIQWPLAKDEASVKLDGSHYFFTLRVPGEEGAEILNYGVTFASKGQEGLLRELDRVLENYSCFEVKEVKGGVGNWEAVSKEVSPDELKEQEKEELVEKSSAAYWTVLAPNVEDYSGSFARTIAAGSGQLVKGILWCGDVTVDRLKWGNEVLKKRVGKKGDEDLEVSPGTLRRIKRVKRLTKMSEKVAIGILSGAVKVSGFFTSSIVNSKVGKKFFSLLPGEIVLASLDGFNKVCDGVEVAGKNVMSTSSIVTIGLVSQRYGEKAAEATNEGLDAAGHAIGAAWAVFKIRKALNPKSAFKPTTLVKAAAKENSSETKTKNKK